MSKTALTEIQVDVLTGLLNIGMGLASASLSDILREDVQLSAPSVEFLKKAELSDLITNKDSDKITCVKQRFRGTFWGSALLLFPEIKSLALVRAMTGDSLSMEDLSDLEQDVLSEIGNIVLNSCLGSLTNVLGDQIRSDVPACMIGSSEEVLFCDCEDANEKVQVMLIALDFSVPQVDIGGYVAFMLDDDSICHLQAEIDAYLQPNSQEMTG